MKIETLDKLFKENKTDCLSWEGDCHDCKGNAIVSATLSEKGEVTISGGAVYDQSEGKKEKYYIKCDDCFQKDPVLRNFRPVETYSRVVGYMRPIDSWNGAKRAEFGMRKTFKVPAL
jgi:hypothetical protein